MCFQQLVSRNLRDIENSIDCVVREIEILAANLKINTCQHRMTVNVAPLEERCGCEGFDALKKFGTAVEILLCKPDPGDIIKNTGEVLSFCSEDRERTIEVL